MTMLTIWGSSQGSYTVSPHPPQDNIKTDDDDDENRIRLDRFRYTFLGWCCACFIINYVEFGFGVYQNVHKR